MAEEMGATVPTATADTTDTSTGQDAAESHFTGSDGAGGSAEHTTWDELPLSLEHVAQLVASGVTPEQAEQRGYETISNYNWKRLRDEFGFSERAAKRAPGLLMPRRDVFGNRIDDQFRPDCSERPDTWETVKYENRHGMPQGLDVPPGVPLDTLAAPGEELWLTEGRKKGDCLAAHGLVVIDVSGVWNWKGRNRKGGKVTLADWDEVALNGREVTIVYDGDTQRKRQVRQAMSALASWLNKKGAKVSCAWLPDTDHKTGVDDYLQDHTVEDLRQLVRPFDEKLDGDPGERKASAATQLIDMALEEYTLGITDDEEPFARGKHSHVALMLRGGKAGLRAELARRYFDAHHTAAPQQALADALATLEGYAHQRRPERLNLRVAASDSSVWIDMGDKAGRVIHISCGEWHIVSHAPVLFRRTRLTKALPTPLPGGDLEALWRFVPVAQQDRPLVLAWLVAALVQVDAAHTILALLAEQGSVKSTATKRLTALIDPSPVMTRKVPRNAEDWVTAVNASWVVGLDNLSGSVPQWLSDSMCRASTGDGDVRRALFTNSDVSVIAFRRVVMFNGIDVVITQGDLADRVLHARLPRVGKYLTDAQVEREWAEAYPGILGGLLDLAAKVHHRLPSIDVPNPPRMADFAAVLACVDKERGTSGMARYREQSQRMAADALSHPFIAELVTRKCIFTAATAKEIVEELTPSGTLWKKPKEWPSSPQQASAQLTRHAPPLRAQGWTIDDDGAHNHRNVRLWTITPPEGEGGTQPEQARQQASHASQASQEDQPPKSDATAGRESPREASPEDGKETPRTGTRDDHRARAEASRAPQVSHTEAPLTCEGEAARAARVECGPSLVQEPPPRPSLRAVLGVGLSATEKDLSGDGEPYSPATVTPPREPILVTGLCEHCGDRGQPALVDKTTRACRGCFAGLDVAAYDWVDGHAKPCRETGCPRPMQNATSGRCNLCQERVVTTLNAGHGRGMEHRLAR